MKNLSRNEKIASVIAVFVVGFIFIFGQPLMSAFKGKTNLALTPQVSIQDEVVGGGETAVTGSRVVVHYVGMLTDGQVFDSSLERGEPIQFVLGSEEIIEGWNQGLVGMRVGGRRIISIPSELGYGPNGFGPIPGGATLIFEVELLRVE